MIEAAYASIEESQGNTTDTAADLVISKISFGFKCRKIKYSSYS